MSFRDRLTLFFVLIVLVPMVAVTIVLFRLIADNETGKADAAVAARTELVGNLYRQAVRDAERVLEEGEQDPQLSEALREGDCQAARERAAELANRPVARIRLVDENGQEVFDCGRQDAIAPASGEIMSSGGEEFGRLEVSVTRAGGFTRRVRRLVGTGLAVRAGTRLLASSVDEVGANPLPDEDTIEGPQGQDLRVVSFDPVPGFGSERVALSVLADLDEALPGMASRSEAVTRARVLAGAILLGFFLLALALALAVSRQLQGQVATLLDAARRLGRGDFSTRVPTEGGDEFAALGAEFNSMSEQLAARLEELRRERERVQASVRRLGQAVGANLDRRRLLPLVVETALEGVGADGGRVMTAGSAGAPMEQAASAGALSGLDGVLDEVEARALRSGATGEVVAHGRSALAHPLIEGEEDRRRVQGVISVARAGAPFSDRDRELFQYLASQAAVLVENLDLHDRLKHEVVTDDLTGLSNRRRFYEAVEEEVERSRRFGHSLGLIMLDLDDFKAINDTRSHPQGDEVLRAVARVLHDESRDIDKPARYGGEELAVVLPETDCEGSYNLAERVRIAIEALVIPALDGGRPVRLTASCGVASLPEAAADGQSLLAAADAALLRAKRAGKNKTVRAGGC